MLVNLLPGIRDFRTPLATGYLWLLTLWLWIPSHFKNVPPATGVPGDITLLAHYAGRAGVGIAISFVAYLIGVLSKSLDPLLGRLGTFNAYVPTLINARVTRILKAIGIRRRVFWDSDDVRFLDIWLWQRLGYVTASFQTENEIAKIKLAYFERADIAAGKLSRTGVYSLENFSQQAADEGLIDRDAKTGYNAYLLEEVPQLGNALVGKEIELYSVYDRLISEYEFRIGISAPLIALIVTLAARWSLLWLLVSFPVLVLLATGSQQRMAAGDLLADAVRVKRIVVALPRKFAPTDTRHSADQSDHANGDDSGFGTKTPDANADQSPGPDGISHSQASQRPTISGSRESGDDT